MSGPSTSTSHPSSVALWQQLQAVAQALAHVRRGVSGTAALDAVPAALRPGVQALLFQVLRQLGRAQALRAQLAQRAPAPLADALLCSALALAWDTAHAPYEPHTLVNQAVEAAKKCVVAVERLEEHDLRRGEIVELKLLGVRPIVSESVFPLSTLLLVQQPQ